MQTNGPRQSSCALLRLQPPLPNGAIENVSVGFLDQSADIGPHRRQDRIHLIGGNPKLWICAERMLKIMELLEVPGPYYLLVAFLNVEGT